MLYFLMETALGGDLYSVYVKNALHGNLPARLIISPKLMWNMKIDVSEEGPSANQGKRTPSNHQGSERHAHFYSALVILATWKFHSWIQNFNHG